MTSFIRLFLALTITFILTIQVQAAPVQSPVLLENLQWTGTSWFGSAIIHNLGSGEKKLVGTFYNVFVWDNQFNELSVAPYGQGKHRGRIYPPAVVADLDRDSIYEVVVASTSGSVAAYEWKNGALTMKAGWPVSACDGGQCPEVRGIAGGDLDNDGNIEIVVTTTQTVTDAQVFVFSANGSIYQPAGYGCTGWPRYNSQTGECGDADDNGQGNSGYGSYGLNVGIGNLDDDEELEIVVTYDNHQINVFNHTGESILASDYFTNRSSQYSGNRMNWGQFIRWFEPEVEENHYNLHTGPWPHPDNNKWLQWTASPPNVIDMDGDGKNEVIGIPNVEEETNPYVTKHHSVMVLEGSYGSGDRSARRLPGWENLPSSGYPQSRDNHTWYPPSSPPAPTTVNLLGDELPETLFAAHDGYLYCISPTTVQLWRYDFTHSRSLMYASEPMVVDLNHDFQPEIIFTTYGDPDNIVPNKAHGYLVILDRNGNMVHDIELPVQGTNENGKGAPAAPTVMDLNGDGNLEIIVQTFGAGLFAYTVPGSAENMLLWPTSRGNYLRDGRSWIEANRLTIAHDVNGDGLVTLHDSLTALQVAAGSDTPNIKADASVNTVIGVEEAIIILNLLVQ